LSERSNIPEYYAAGFPPVVGPGARILILGTLPGAASLKQQQYYAHPQNAFWKMLEVLFHIPAKTPYTERCEKVTAAKLAIWDVCHSACRPGSLDSAISAETVIANDIKGLLASYPGIELIAFNGNTAATLFKKHIKNTALPDTVTLPSTSPAHASLRFEEKLERWRILQVRLSQAFPGHDSSSSL
jgi:TDG/mug DNA glycosylase family protein